jgi:hypothetical protein
MGSAAWTEVAAKIIPRAAMQRAVLVALFPRRVPDFIMTSLDLEMPATDEQSEFSIRRALIEIKRSATSCAGRREGVRMSLFNESPFSRIARDEDFKHGRVTCGVLLYSLPALWSG